MKPITGSCLCGGVAFEITATPVRFLYCHCPSCRKSSGSIHAANIAYPVDAITWTKGSDLIRTFVDTQDNPGYPRCFCSHCGSAVPKLSRNKQFMVVPSGLLNEDPGIRPQANIFWSEHADWYVPAEDLPKHAERP